MSSDRRIRASRANGAKSRGPKTPESKARSSANNLRHGLLARMLVLEDEDAQPFAHLLATLERELNPQNGIERALVENMASSRWRLLRLWAIERSNLEIEMKKQASATPDPVTRVALAFRALSDGSRSLDLLNRYEARFDRQYVRSLKLFLELQHARQSSQPAVPANNAFCHATLVPKTDTNIPAPTPSAAVPLKDTGNTRPATPEGIPPRPIVIVPPPLPEPASHPSAPSLVHAARPA